MKLDRFDLRILQSLQAYGRVPAARLAAKVGLTTSPTWGRVNKLEEAGVVRGYHADIAIDLLTGITQVIVHVTLSSNRIRDLRRFENAVLAMPEVVECYAVEGQVDYALRFVVSNVGAYQAAIERALHADLGIERYSTYFVTKPIKPFNGVPLEQLLAQLPER